MDRRRFLLGAVTAPITTASGKLAAAHAGEEAGADWRRFEVMTEVTLADGPAVLWLPLAQTAWSYQRALSLAWRGDADEAELVDDAVYGAPVLRLTWAKETSPRRVSVVQTVETRDRDTRPDPATPAGLKSRALLKPTQFISQLPKRRSRNARTGSASTGSFSSSTTLRTSAGSTGTQPCGSR